MEISSQIQRVSKDGLLEAVRGMSQEQEVVEVLKRIGIPFKRYRFSGFEIKTCDSQRSHGYGCNSYIRCRQGRGEEFLHLGQKHLIVLNALEGIGQDCQHTFIIVSLVDLAPT
jgi:hypothetical protein